MEEKELTINETFEKLEETIARMQTKDLPLEESLKCYEEGIRLIADCNKKIKDVEGRVLVLRENGEVDEF